MKGALVAQEARSATSPATPAATSPATTAATSPATTAAATSPATTAATSPATTAATSPATTEATSLASRLSWRRLAELTGLLGAFFYVCGWLFFAAFYAEFDVTPEMAGITFQFVVVRAGIIMAFAFILFLICASLFRRLMGRLLISDVWSVPNTAFAVMLIILGILIVAAVIFTLNAWGPWRALPSPFNYALMLSTWVVAVIVVLIAGWMALLLMDYKAEQEHVKVASPIVSLLIFAFVGALIMSALMIIAPDAAHRVRAGAQFSLFGFRVDHVKVVPATENVLVDLAQDPCLTLIGYDGSNFVLYSALRQRTHIVNSQLISISRDLEKPCES